MEDRIRELVAKAFRVASALEANQAIARARRERAGSDPDDDDGPSCRSYEIILGGWQAFAEEQLPKLVYHLESVGANLPACRGTIVSAFVGDELYLVDAGDFLEAAMRQLGFTAAQLSERYGTGERRTAAPGAPLLLPGPKGRN